MNVTFPTISFLRSSFVFLWLCICTISLSAIQCRMSTTIVEIPTKEARWIDISPDSSLRPSPRYNSSAVYDSVTNSMIIFGGRNTSGNLAEVWSFNLTTKTWTNITPSDTSPPPRFAHTAVIDPTSRKMYIWSGQGGGFFNDSWAFDLSSQRWQNVTPAGTKPSVRYGSVAVHDPRKNSMVIFAGFTNQGRFDDSWEFVLGLNSWTDVTPNGTRPLARCLHAAAYDPTGHQLIMYGGQRPGPLDDIWAFDLSTHTWTELSPAIRPTGRLFATITALRNGKVVIFGGSTNFGEVNEIWVFDIVERSWKLLNTPSPQPPARQAHTAIYIPQKDWMIIFGGSSGNTMYNDVWVLENVTPASQ